MSKENERATKIQRVPTEQSKEIKLDTPQQDSEWTESRRFEWIKKSSARLIKVFNT